MCVSVCRLADGNSVCVFLGSRSSLRSSEPLWTLSPLKPAGPLLTFCYIYGHGVVAISVPHHRPRGSRLSLCSGETRVSLWSH
ncbi:hypothetical protein 9L [Ranavirus ambystoma1]|uniref:Uncharacterized protein n=2 Tax=Ranavirus TaxID=10492 RepID=A0A0U2REA9_9VIRU|nr:hypothetical protein 9L [Ambystoma tigrinum virus]